jgi:hypothetical protein
MTPLRLALILMAICGVAAWQVTIIPESAIQMAVGPTLVPAVIVGALTLFSVLYGISAWRGRQVDESLAPEQTPLPGSQRRMLTLLMGGVLFMALVDLIGFVIPATLCGMCIAKAFDAPFGWKSTSICVSISAFFWWLFAILLGVGLGPALPFGF